MGRTITNGKKAVDSRAPKARVRKKNPETLSKRFETIVLKRRKDASDNLLSFKNRAPVLTDDILSFKNRAPVLTDDILSFKNRAPVLTGDILENFMEMIENRLVDVIEEGDNQVNFGWNIDPSDICWPHHAIDDEYVLAISWMKECSEWKLSSHNTMCRVHIMDHIIGARVEIVEKWNSLHPDIPFVKRKGYGLKTADVYYILWLMRYTTKN